MGGDLPVVVGDTSAVNVERILALEPDLILALYSGITRADYEQLSQIAPTVAQPAAYVDYGVPWQELTRTVGQAVGKAAEADALVTEVEARFTEVQAQHPEFAGTTSVIATPYQGIYLYGPEDLRGRLLDDLGFALPEGLDAIAEGSFGGNISLERTDLLDVDVILWLDATSGEGPLGNPVLREPEGPYRRARGLPRLLRRPAGRSHLVRHPPEPFLFVGRACTPTCRSYRRRPGNPSDGRRRARVTVHTPACGKLEPLAERAQDRLLCRCTCGALHLV